jgi:uncharacterized protein (DUF2252 family)
MAPLATPFSFPSRYTLMALRDPVAEFQDYNRAFARRNPELLRFKIDRMAASPFAFFRGTFHLFARDILERLLDVVPRQPGTDVELDLVGDLHSENYGTFQADNGLHYDVNDFDETTRGRFDFDVRRLATSFILAAQERGDGLGDAVAAALGLLASYTDTVQRLLKKGKPLDLDVNENAASGSAAVDRLLKAAAATKRPAFIEKLTEQTADGRRLVRSLRYFNLTDDQHAQALRLLEDYRMRFPDAPTADFFKPEDACGRVSGIGSMGRLRYVVLVAGKGSRDARNVLLEFKESLPSAYDRCRQREGDAKALVERAERVITVQRQSQTASNPRLGWAVDGGQSFQVREIGPHDSRVDAKTLKNPAELRDVARVQAAILARIHARAASRVVGVANAQAELKDVESFCQRVLAFALAYADQARRDWQRFVGQRAELDDCEKWAAAG